MSRKHTAYHIINTDPGQTHSKQQLNKNLKITFASPSKNTDENEKDKKKRKANGKCFVLHANAKIYRRNQPLKVFLILTKS